MRPTAILALLAQCLILTTAYISDGAPFGWRMPCKRFSNYRRVDPIVSPGEPSHHAHGFFGASRFHSLATYEDLRASECSSCRAVEDKSSYWVPPLYFRYPDGSLENVPDVGGILVYYQRLDMKIEAFPAGFRMIAGDNKRRALNSRVPFWEHEWQTSYWGPKDFEQSVARDRAIGFNCMNYGRDGEPTLARHGMPTREELRSTCLHGVRAEVAFPSCWDGKNMDSPDHMSHIAYEQFVWKGGPCPASHPVRLPQLLYEVIFDTGRFANRSGDFIWANGDSSGYSFHADFMNGWDPAFLKAALETCKNPHGDINMLPCNMLTLQDINTCEAEDYKPLTSLSREVCDGTIDSLCGSSNWGDESTTTWQEPAAGPLSSPYSPPANGNLSIPWGPSISSQGGGPPDVSAEAGPADIEVSGAAPEQPATDVVNETPSVSVFTQTVQETVTQDVWMTVYERNEHAHHLHHQ